MPHGTNGREAVRHCAEEGLRHETHAAILAFGVQSYRDVLASILAPLRLLVLALEADVHVAWQRAVAERGQGWSDWMVDIFESRDLPQHPDGPLQDVDDLLQRFAVGQRQSLSLIAQWPVQTLVLDTTAKSLEQLKVSLLEHVGLSPTPRSRLEVE